MGVKKEIKKETKKETKNEINGIDFLDIDYIITNCKNKKSYMDVCAIDIGNRNFALCIERFSVPFTKGENICHNGEIILFCKEDFGVRTKNGIKDLSIFLNCKKFLDSISEHINRCDVILIEQQLRRNPFAQKLEHFVYSYFVLNFATFKYYISFPAKHKTMVLKAPKGLSKPERKKWCSEKFCEILAERGDSYSLEIISKNKSKIDDLCDTGCMIQAWKILNIKKLF